MDNKKNIYDSDKTRRMIPLMMVFAAVLLIFPVATQARLVLDDVHFDPAIVTSGDEVDIIVQFHDEVVASEDWIGNPEYKYNIELVAEDSLTENYMTIIDSEGDQLSSPVIYSGQYYNQKFRVKVNHDAPAANYEFKVTGQWYKNGEPVDSVQFIRFEMPVKREGIIIDINTLETLPAEVRPGDNYVKIFGNIENSGEKDAKSVTVTVNLPEGLTASYANDNRLSVGRINTGERKEVVFFLDVDDQAEPGLYQINYKFNYMDVDNNKYEIIKTLPFRVKKRPYLEVVDFEGEGLAGADAKLSITVKNTGTESAESVDVRLLKQNSQPFEFDVRSNYVGELEPGEEGLAIFDIGILDSAEIKEHDFKVIIRARGDSDEGDDNVYTFNRRAKLDVTGEKTDYFRIIGFGLLGVIIVFMIVKRFIIGSKKGGKK